MPAPDASPALPVEAANPAPQETTAETETRSQSNSRYRAGRWIAATLVAAALVPALLWWHHNANYVVSRNAMVRAHVSELGTHVAGVVKAVHVEAGMRVQAGDILLQLEDARFRAELDRATAEHRAMLARLSTEQTAINLERERLELTIQRAEAEVRGTTAALAAANSEATNAAVQHRAREALLPKRAISKERVQEASARADTLRARANASRAEQEASEHALAETRHGQRELRLREQRLEVLAAERDQSAAAVSRARADLAATTIRAPADGAIIRPLAQPGMAIEAGVPAISMWFSDNTWIEAWIDEASLADVTPGSTVRVTSPALPGEVLEGRVQTVGLATDYEMPLDYLPKPRDQRMEQAPLVGIAIRLNDFPEIFRPGMSASASIERVRP